jgi:hypothetical protein
LQQDGGGDADVEALDEAARLRLYARGLYLSVPHAREILA